MLHWCLMRCSSDRAAIEMLHLNSSWAMISFCPTWWPVRTFYAATWMSIFGVMSFTFWPIVHFSPVPWVPNAVASAAPDAVAWAKFIVPVYLRFLAYFPQLPCSDHLARRPPSSFCRRTWDSPWRSDKWSRSCEQSSVGSSSVALSLTDSCFH